MPTADPPVKVPHEEQGPTEKKLPPWPVDDDPEAWADAYLDAYPWLRARLGAQ